MATDEDRRRVALDRLLPMQQEDFEGILRAMEGLPVTIRLLDPPLHEFLPDLTDLLLEIESMRTEGRPKEEIADQERIAARVKALHEANPMLGTRGCRLGIQHPEIYEMQVRAIVRAARAVDARGVEIMHPLVGFAEELRRPRSLTETVIEQEGGQHLGILVGTMIEVPRAALTADEIAEVADFCSFGTNDLTQMTLAFSRDDAEGGFLPDLPGGRCAGQEPLRDARPARGGEDDRAGLRAGPGRQTVDQARHLRRARRRSGIDRFCEATGLDYVSCSPFRVPIARLAAAQAVLAGTETDGEG